MQGCMARLGGLYFTEETGKFEIYGLETKFKIS